MILPDSRFALIEFVKQVCPIDGANHSLWAYSSPRNLADPMKHLAHRR